MEEIIKAATGDYLHYIFALSLVTVVWKGGSIKKPHILILLVLTVIFFILFFAAFVASFPLYREHRVSGDVLNIILFGLSASCVYCGSTIGFWLVGKQLRLIKDEV